MTAHLVRAASFVTGAALALIVALEMGILRVGPSASAAPSETTPSRAPKARPVEVTPSSPSSVGANENQNRESQTGAGRSRSRREGRRDSLAGPVTGSATGEPKRTRTRPSFSPPSKPSRAVRGDTPSERPAPTGDPADRGSADEGTGGPSAPSDREVQDRGTASKGEPRVTAILARTRAIMKTIETRTGDLPPNLVNDAATILETAANELGRDDIPVCLQDLYIGSESRPRQRLLQCWQQLQKTVQR